MKKFVLLSILLLTLVVSVSAQYTAAYIPPSDDCYSVCKRDCIAQKMSDDECIKMCDDRCAPKPVPSARPILVRPQPVSENCEDMCKRLASQTSLTAANVAGFNLELYVQCMRDRCKQDCESSCRMIYGAQAQDCILKLCKPQVPSEEPCGVKCRQMLSDCEQNMMRVTAAQIDCKTMYGECMRRECGEPECPSCPKCPSRDCEDNCVNGYYSCAKMARSMTAPAGRPEDVQEEYLRRCSLGISDCLNGCAPELPPEYSCPERCRMVENECLAAGVDAESCGMKAKDCMTRCYPQAPEPRRLDCKDICVKRSDECLAAGIDPEQCRKDLGSCMMLCAPGSPSIGQASRIPRPEDLAGLNPQPEPPSWFAKLIGLFRGG